MTTIYDVAKEAGCAPSTVSKYITKHGYVSQTMGKAIAAAMVKLDYHYNGLARNLSTRTNNRVGIIVPFLDHPYFQKLVNAISIVATKAGKEIVILPTGYDADREIGYLQELEHNLVNALIITSHALPTAKIKTYQRFGPIVFCEQVADPQLSSVNNNRVATFNELFTELKNAGQTHLGFLFIRQARQSKSTQDMLSAYQAVFGHQPDPNLIAYNCRTTADGKNAYASFINHDHHLQAVINESDIAATGVFQASQQAGNFSLTVIGQGNSLISQLLGFSSIDQHLTKMGQAAMKLAIQPAAAQQVNVNSEIIWR